MSTTETTTVSIPKSTVAFQSAAEVLDFFNASLVTRQEARLILGLDIETIHIAEKTA